MSFLDIEQRSPEWYARRKNHIGASEVPAIMGTDDWRTAHDVFKAKIEGESFSGNFATERGTQLEPIVRAKLEELFGYIIETPTLVYPVWPVLSASLDGISPDRSTIFEIKCPAMWKHTGALCGFLPDTYVDQVQAQLLVTGAKECIYASYTDKEDAGFDLALVTVTADKDRQSEILKRCKAFWDIVKSGEWREPQTD